MGSVPGEGGTVEPLEASEDAMALTWCHAARGRQAGQMASIIREEEKKKGHPGLKRASTESSD